MAMMATSKARMRLVEIMIFGSNESGCSFFAVSLDHPFAGSPAPKCLKNWLAGLGGKNREANSFSQISVKHPVSTVLSTVELAAKMPVLCTFPWGGTGLLVGLGRLHPGRDREDKRSGVEDVPSVGRDWHCSIRAITGHLE